MAFGVGCRLPLWASITGGFSYGVLGWIWGPGPPRPPWVGREGRFREVGGYGVMGRDLGSWGGIWDPGGGFGVLGGEGGEFSGLGSWVLLRS